MFPRITVCELDKFVISGTDDNCHDLLWFLERYTMIMDTITHASIFRGRRKFKAKVREMKHIPSVGYTPGEIQFKEPFLPPRNYQVTAAELWLKTRMMILADEMGLGKSLTATLGYVVAPKLLLSGLIVSQTHSPKQWK